MYFKPKNRDVPSKSVFFFAAVILAVIPRDEVVDDWHNLAWYLLPMGRFIAVQQEVVKTNAEFLLHPSIHPDGETDSTSLITHVRLLATQY